MTISLRGIEPVKTRFSVELQLREAERVRLFQLFEYLAEFDGGTALMPQDLPDALGGPDARDDVLEEMFVKQISVEALGFKIVAADDGAVRIYDIDGVPNLRMLCQIIADAVPRLLPLQFSFALVDEAEHRFSGGLVVMTAKSAEIQTIDSMLARRGGMLLH